MNNKKTSKSVASLAAKNGHSIPIKMDLFEPLK